MIPSIEGDFSMMGSDFDNGKSDFSYMPLIFEMLAHVYTNKKAKLHTHSVLKTLNFSPRFCIKTILIFTID